MAKRVVVWTETAAKQRREVLKYWTLRNGSTTFAEKLIKIIKEKTKLIAKFPQSGRLSDFENVHVSAMGHFSIFYKVEEDQIIIVAFWDNRQDPKSLLKLIQQNS
jgi:plasmid stabilization system protein ParE